MTQVSTDEERQDLEIYPECLEKKFAAYVILLVRDNAGACKRDIIKKEDGNERTKFIRIKELIEEGIIYANTDKRQHNSAKLYLTEKGQEIATHLEAINRIYRG